MRPKIIISVLVVAALALTGLSLVSRLVRSRTAPPGIESHLQGSAESSTGKQVELPARSLAPATASRAGTNLSPAASAEADAAHERYVRQRIAELDDLAMNNDGASRDTILSELQNPDQAIRQAALEAIVQFGDRSVVPRLEEVAAATEDPDEKAAILEAVDYLNLPSLTEYLAAQRGGTLTNRATNGLVRDPRRRR